MKRRPLILAALAAAAVVAGCADTPPPVDEAWGEFLTAYRELESPAEKTALAEGLLTRYPDSEYSGSLAGIIAYYRGEEMDDPGGAYDRIDAALAGIETPAHRFEVELALFPLARELDRDMELEAVADELAAHRPLSYSENNDVAELAVQHEQWALAERHAGAALSLATAEAYRAENPDREIADDELASRVARRRVDALAVQGWAMANQGRPAEAMAVFEAAAPAATRSYLGVPDGSLYSYWGRTALMLGDAARAFELLGPSAVLGDDDEALAAYRDAFVQLNGDDTAFAEQLWTARQSLAREVDDFRLADYQGTEHEMGGLRQGKVVLLAFWFPT